MESAGKKERARKGERLWTGWVKVLAESQLGPASNPDSASSGSDTEFMNTHRGNEGLRASRACARPTPPDQRAPRSYPSPRVQPLLGTAGSPGTHGGQLGLEPDLPPGLHGACSATALSLPLQPYEAHPTQASPLEPHLRKSGALGDHVLKVCEAQLAVTVRPASSMTLSHTSTTTGPVQLRLGEPG